MSWTVRVLLFLLICANYGCYSCKQCNGWLCEKYIIYCEPVYRNAKVIPCLIAGLLSGSVELHKCNSTVCNMLTTEHYVVLYQYGTSLASHQLDNLYLLATVSTSKYRISQRRILVDNCSWRCLCCSIRKGIAVFLFRPWIKYRVQMCRRKQEITNGKVYQITVRRRVLT